MLLTLSLTLVIEAFVAAGIAFRWKKPAKSILLTASLGNLLTQTLLWLALTMFPSHYLLTLFVLEALIWLIESLILFLVPANQLTWREALTLSLWMNLISFWVGWFLPV
jgi:hypothetical protein